MIVSALGIAVQAAADSGAKTPMGAKARELYEALVDKGEGGRDFSVLLRSLAELAAKT